MRETLEEAINSMVELLLSNPEEEDYIMLVFISLLTEMVMKEYKIKIIEIEVSQWK